MKNAIEAAARLGNNVQFIEFDGTRYHFQVIEYWTLETIHIDGNVTEPKQATRLTPGAYPKYWVLSCYPCQLENGDLEFLFKNKLTQEINERFKNV